MASLPAGATTAAEAKAEARAIPNTRTTVSENQTCGCFLLQPPSHNIMYCQASWQLSASWQAEPAELTETVLADPFVAGRSMLRVPKHWKTCKFKHNMDWNEGARAPQQPAADPVACCALCSKTPSCAASTFHNSSAGAGGCFLKSAGDVAKGLKTATKACVACVPFEQ